MRLRPLLLSRVRLLRLLRGLLLRLLLLLPLLPHSSACASALAGLLLARAGGIWRNGHCERRHRAGR